MAKKVLIYDIRSGALFEAAPPVAGGEVTPGKRLARGYSGHPPFVNDVTAQAVVARGPIPVGNYNIGRAFNHVRLGPCVFYLDPWDDNSMHGRSGFFIHGDNEFGNQTASHGCIILSRSIREFVRVYSGGVLMVRAL